MFQFTCHHLCRSLELIRQEKMWSSSIIGAINICCFRTNCTCNSMHFCSEFTSLLVMAMARRLCVAFAKNILRQKNLCPQQWVEFTNHDHYIFTIKIFFWLPIYHLLHLIFRLFHSFDAACDWKFCPVNVRNNFPCCLSRQKQTTTT